MKDRSSYELNVKFYDVHSHVADGTPLVKMGELIGFEKLKIPDGYSIEHMDVLLQEYKLAFENYGLRDVEIAVRYYQKLLTFARQHTGDDYLPPTASSLSVRLFLKTLKDNGIDFCSAFGVHQEVRTFWNNKKCKVITKRQDAPNDMRAILEPFATKCYHGGRGESFHFGPTEVSCWNDFDLAAAYTTGLVDLRRIDYDNFHETRQQDDFKGHVLGFALVDFVFPEDTRYPCLSVVGSNDGLFFPLTGRSYCTAPEIEVALNMGCKIDIRYGIVIPWLEGSDEDADLRLFEPFVTKVRDLRGSFTKGSLDELYAKLLGNGLYGKTAQAVKPKNVFDTGGMHTVQLPFSKVTNASIAAHTTGFIRAVLGELMAGVPANRRVISVTTDGFITDASLAELKLDGVMATRFADLCLRVTGHRNILERKHRVVQLISVKTRGQITCVPYENDPVILAKANVAPPPSVTDHNAYMLELFLNRYPGQICQTRPFTPIRDQWIKNADVVRIMRDSTMNLDYDFKRKLVNPLMAEVVLKDVGQPSIAEHIRLDSVPWLSVKEADQCRAIFNGWRKNNCLKTLKDWESWQDYFLFAKAQKRHLSTEKRGAVKFRNRGKGIDDVLKKMFLRAYTQGLCGLTKSMTYAQLAEWLTLQGYKTNTDDIKNSNRATFFEGVVPATEQAMALANILQEGFPSIELGKFFAADKASN